MSTGATLKRGPKMLNKFNIINSSKTLTVFHWDCWFLQEELLLLSKTGTMPLLLQWHTALSQGYPQKATLIEFRDCLTENEQLELPAIVLLYFKELWNHMEHTWEYFHLFSWPLSRGGFTVQLISLIFRAPHLIRLFKALNLNFEFMIFVLFLLKGCPKFEQVPGLTKATSISTLIIY